MTTLEKIDRLHNRLNEFKDIQKGWFDGELGLTIDLQDIQLAKDFVSDLVFNYLAFPELSVYPTPEGKIKFEAETENEKWFIEILIYRGISICLMENDFVNGKTFETYLEESWGVKQATKLIRFLLSEFLP